MANSAVEKQFPTQELKEKLLDVLHNDFQTTPEDASDQQVYEALSKIVVGILKAKRRSSLLKLSLRARRRSTIFQWNFLWEEALKLLFITLKCRSRLQRSLRTWAFL